MPSHAEQEAKLRRMFPGLTPEELDEVRETLHGYFEIALRICERRQQERRQAVDQPPKSS